LRKNIASIAGRPKEKTPYHRNVRGKGEEQSLRRPSRGEALANNRLTAGWGLPDLNASNGMGKQLFFA